MKTYYGQMTREDLCGIYIEPKSYDHYIAFQEMCFKVGIGWTNGERKVDKELYKYIVVMPCFGHIELARTMKKTGCLGYPKINWQPEPKDLKSQLKQSMTNLEKRKAEAQKANEKLEDAKKEVDRIASKIEKHYEDIDKVCCSVRINELTNTEAASDIPEGVDVDDPNTWKCGDIVRCIESQTHSIPEGSLYTFIKYKHDVLGFILDAGADDIIYASGYIEKFRFVRRP